MPSKNSKPSLRCIQQVFIRVRKLLVPAIIVLTGGFVSADEKAAPSKALSAQALKAFQTEAAQYRIQHDGADKSFQLKAAPILRWTNPVRVGQDGAVFLWMQNNRPQVIGVSFKPY